MSTSKLRKYYIKGDILPCEEDNRNEFKGHLNLCKEEIPSWAVTQKGEKASRKPISRNLNAFLNSGTGGLLYLGVMDNGKIMGFNMSILQRDHFLKALDDLMSRYKPKVLPHQYSVSFTPVFLKAHTTDEIVQRLEFIANEEIGDVYKDRKHVFRDANYCWCDKDSVASINVSNRLGQEFVVEVMIKEWDPCDPRNPSAGRDPHLKFQPYYCDEEGKIYFRRQASVVQYSLNSIAQITKHEVKDKCEAEIGRLQRQIKELEEKKAAKLSEQLSCVTSQTSDT